MNLKSIMITFSLIWSALFLYGAAKEQPIKNVIADAARPLPLSAVRLPCWPFPGGRDSLPETDGVEYEK